MSDPVAVREISLAEAGNERLANFAGPMEQNLRHVEERLRVCERARVTAIARGIGAGIENAQR